MLDERAKRRPEFREGPAVVLADGQEWTLPRVAVSFAADDSEDGFRLAYPADVAPLIAAREAAEGGAGLIRAELALGRHLLTANYDLAGADLAGLLVFGYGDDADPGHARIREEVMDAAYGRAPRPKA